MRVPLELVSAVERMIAGVGAVGTASVGGVATAAGTETDEDGFESPAPSIPPPISVEAKLDVARAALASIGAAHTEKPAKLPPFEARAAKRRDPGAVRTNEFGDPEFDDYEF